jgi:hypothetical protein
MALMFRCMALGWVVTFAITLGTVPAYAAARELATAQGTIMISDARPDLRAPLCSELVVEARDALDNHLIAKTQSSADERGACRYALSVPAQTAVWLRLRPALVAGAGMINGASVTPAQSMGARQSSGSVGLRFSIIAPTTYFFAPNEQKTVPLSY